MAKDKKSSDLVSNRKAFFNYERPVRLVVAPSADPTDALLFLLGPMYVLSRSSSTDIKAPERSTAQHDTTLTTPKMQREFDSSRMEHKEVMSILSCRRTLSEREVREENG